MPSYAFHLQVSRAELARSRPQRPRRPPRAGAGRSAGAAAAAVARLDRRDRAGDRAPADYVLQSVLAGVAAVCGAGVRVRVTPAWDEPLVLWLAAVGEALDRQVGGAGADAPAAGGHRAGAALPATRSGAPPMPSVSRRAARPCPSCRRRSWRADADPAVLVGHIVAGNPCGVLLWRDGAGGLDGRRGGRRGDHRARWLAAWTAGAVTVARAAPAARGRFAHFPVSILETVRPERLKASLQAGDESLAARFLFAWPGPQPYRALVVFERSRDEEILQRLRALSRLGDERRRSLRDRASMRAAAPRSTACWRRCMPSATRPRGWRRRGSAAAGR